jgi:hypothetical protein
MSRRYLPIPALAALAILALTSGCSSCGNVSEHPGRRYVGTPARLTIGPAGGSVTSSDGNLTVVVPPGALADPVDVVISQFVNPAPGGQGNAYELGPSGQLFALPVTLVFKAPAGQPIGQFWVSFLLNGNLPNGGLWFRSQSVAVDGTAGTLSTAVTDFGWTDWSLVSTGPNVGKDLAGVFTLVSTLEIPFTATTTQLTLAYAGEDARATYYFPVGPLTLQTPVTIGAATCTPFAPPGATVQVKNDAVAELRKGADPIPLILAIDAIWNLACSDGSTALADTRFDTLGINLGGCTRGYVGVPVLTPSRIQCDAGNGCFYRIDCGARGMETATFELVPCTPGVACASANGPCHTAAISCATGFPVCTDTGTLADGTSCGTNLVCGGGVCNACTQGAACTSTNACAATATYECSSGFPVCTDRTFVAAGTSCGSGLVCSPAGVCTACTQGATCTSTNPCAATATIECSSGLPVCTDRTFAAAGTSCGTNQVCSAAGVCEACTQGAACTPATPNPCATSSTVECSSGVPVCTDRTFAAAGTSCGTNMVCSAAGVCGSCTQGAACTSANPCAATATDECSSGLPVCTDRTFAAAGTGCGTNLVCSPTGVCTACTQGATCTSTNPCAATATDECSSGLPVCTDRTFAAAGTSCGTNLVCSPTGVCTACTQGATCTSANPCAASATYECSSGLPACTDRTYLADGTSCGTGSTCNAGACVPSRTVTGTRQVTNWPDAGPTAPVPAPEVAVVPPSAPVQVSALVRDGKGGWVSYPGTFPAPGAFSIPNVPVGPYLLEYVDATGFRTLVDTSADSVDLGYDVAGRAGLALPLVSTPVTFALTGLSPWNTGGDEVQITCSDTDVWDLLPAPNPPFASGVTSGDALDDWLAGNAVPGPLPLLNNDQLLVHQLATATDASSGQSYQYASNWVSLGGVTLSSGAPATLSPTLAAISPTGSLPAAAWSLSQFDLLPSMNPAAITDARAHSLVVGASHQPLASAGPAARGSPRLLAIRLPRGTPDPALGTLPYGQFLGAGWNEWWGADFTVQVSYLAPAAAAAVVETASVGRREAMPFAGGAIAPTLTPVLAPLVNGQSAFSALVGVGTTPTVSWTAPVTGSPTRYVLELYRLDAVAGASAATPVAAWVTAATSLAFPPAVLVAGSTYFARITSQAVPGDSFGAATPAPLRLPALYAYASVLTGTFTP